MCAGESGSAGESNEHTTAREPPKDGESFKVKRLLLYVSVLRKSGICNARAVSLIRYIRIVKISNEIKHLPQRERERLYYIVLFVTAYTLFRYEKLGRALVMCLASFNLKSLSGLRVSGRLRYPRNTDTNLQQENTFTPTPHGYRASQYV